MYFIMQRASVYVYIQVGLTKSRPNLKKTGGRDKRTGETGETGRDKRDFLNYYIQSIGLHAGCPQKSEFWKS